MGEQLDPEAYDITVGEIGMMPDDDYDPKAGVEITEQRYASLREHLFETYDGSTASRFAVRDLTRLEADRYVVSFHRHGGGRGSWQSEYVAIAAWDAKRAEWELPAVERVAHYSWH